MALLYLRCIDDIFIIWKGTKEQLITFIDELNKKHKTTKFEYKIPSKKIPFLGTVVYQDKDNNQKQPATLLKKETLAQVFSYNFAKFLKTPFLKNTFGRLPLNNLKQPYTVNLLILSSF